MSRWTHVMGSIGLDSTLYEVDKDGQIYLPFPKKQLVLRDKAEYTLEQGGKLHTRYHISEYSLPRALPYIKKAMEMLPSGERDVISYNTYQDPNRIDAGCGLEDFEEEYLKGMLLKKNKDKVSSEDLENKSILDILNIHFGMTNETNIFSLTINADIRYCSGIEFLDALEKACVYLINNDIYFYSSELKWIDEYLSNRYSFEFVANQTSKYSFSFRILNAKTNKIIAEKFYTLIYDYENRKYNIEVNYSKNWKRVYKKVASYG